MRIRLFNKGKGWYISATNYKDKEDKAYLNVYFPSTVPIPSYHETEKGYDTVDLDIIEGKFTSYKGKVGLTVFNYEKLTNIELSPVNTIRPSEISDDELPFL